MKDIVDSLFEKACVGCSVEVLTESQPPKCIYKSFEPADGVYLKFRREGKRPFYGWFSKAKSPDRPILVISPGYGAELYAFPKELTEHFNVLSVSPLGYYTPDGPNESLRVKGAWPVLFNTVFGVGETYDDWMADAIAAVNWVGNNLDADGRSLVFYGTSQGGGMSLNLGAVFGCRTKAICSDEPFLIGFSSVQLDRVIGFSAGGYDNPIISYKDAAKRLEAVDPLCYADHIKCPVLLGAGELDDQCEPEFIEMVFNKLSCEKKYVLFENRAHGYNERFYLAAKEWLKGLGLM